MSYTTSLFEPITSNGRADSVCFFAGQEIQYQLTRTGDLVSGLALFITIDPIQIDPSITLATINATKYKAYQDASGVTRFLSKVFVDDLARALVQQVKLTIGNYEIETHTGDWLHIWDKLTRPADRSYVDTAPVAHGGVTKYSEGDFHNFDGNLNYGVTTAANAAVDPTRYTAPAGVPIDGVLSSSSLNAISTGFRWAQAPQSPGSFHQFAYPQVPKADSPMYIYLPLSFTCTQAPALSLPMIALQYHDVRLSVKLNTIDQVSIFQSSGGMLRVKDAPQIFGTGAGIDMRVVATYIFLDDAERRSTALSPHQYLITEIQTQQFAVDTNSNRQSYQLHFNHPVTELFVYFNKSAYRDPTQTAVVNHYWNWTMDGPQAEMANFDASETALGAPSYRTSFSRMNLSLNQQKLWDDARDSVYFSWFLPTKYHTRTPTGTDRVAVLPFALDTETWRPTGSVNFSRIDSVMLLLEFDVPSGQHLPSGTFNVYARNFNILKVVSGMGGKSLHHIVNLMLSFLTTTCFYMTAQLDPTLTLLICVLQARGSPARAPEQSASMCACRVCKQCQTNKPDTEYWQQPRRTKSICIHFLNFG
jgi:hypothetical protein